MFRNILMVTLSITLCTAYVHLRPTINRRIIGGKDGNIKDHPYLLSLVAEDSHFCGAGLIDPLWALTSAHCMQFLKPEELTIRANSTFWEKGLNMTVKRIISHPDFSYPTGDNDIALIELSAPLKCTYCKTIPLSTTVPRSEEKGITAGWGITDMKSEDPWPILQEAVLPVVDFDECDANYLEINQPLTDNMFCAGYMEKGGIDSCIGDSGGPFVINGTLAGVISWGHDCALPHYPGVYTLVSKYLKWIKDNSGV